jgi:hypothetical protein
MTVFFVRVYFSFMKSLIGLCEPCSYLLRSDFLKFSVVSILRVLCRSQRIANNISNKE